MFTLGLKLLLESPTIMSSLFKSSRYGTDVVETLALSPYEIVGLEAIEKFLLNALPKITATSSRLALFWFPLEDMKIERSLVESIEFSSAYATELYAHEGMLFDAIMLVHLLITAELTDVPEYELIIEYIS
ncbi:hypothetical protein SDC9_148489 [bioreactor metagenome]|uniref:Uncharacterized protein n=1 Tax=bioreactor metagenome TaxID=1076179 RepID=A0A645EL60_9ZZZZ